MTPITRSHPTEGALQAFLDGESGAWASLHLRLHLRGCAACRQNLEEIRARGATIATLIHRATPEVDPEEAWARFVVRSGGRADRRTPSRRSWSAAVAALVVLAFIALLLPDRHPPDSGEVFAMVRAAQAHEAPEVVRDACCEDHDGGDFPDDGLLTLSLPGERVTVVVIYEDIDHSGTFTPGDIMRYVSRTTRQ